MLDASLRQRSADETAERQPERGGGDGHRVGVRDTEIVDELLPVGCGRPVSSDEAYGPEGEAHLRIETEYRAEGGSDDILEHDQYGHQCQEDHDQFPSLFQHTEGGHETDRTEECHHEDVLQGLVEVEFSYVRAVEQAVDKGEYQTPDHGRRYAETSQRLGLPDQH